MAETLRGTLITRFNHFNRFTALPVMATACEIKPVMRDDDYIACGANPPESPMGNRR